VELRILRGGNKAKNAQSQTWTLIEETLAICLQKSHGMQPQSKEASGRAD